jgi:thiol:disulfide interchange protein DsbD
MALPYLLFTAYPRGLTWLPAPGRWMESLKQLSGFLLLGTAVWLLWIFGRLAGADAQAVAVAALLGIGLAAYIYGRWGTPVQAVGRRLLARLLAGALLLLSLAVGLWTASVFAPGASVMGSEANDSAGEVQRWEKFSPERLSELRAAGRPVFIDFTADWCLSCKVNEALTFRSPEVWTAMADRGIVALKADWTRRDPEISRALRGYGRSGVPVYVLYAAGPSAPPVLLPEVLSESLFLSALEAMPDPQGQTDQAKLRSPDSGR